MTKDIFKSLLAVDELNEVFQLIQSTRQVPEQEVVQEAFDRYLEQGWYRGVEVLMGITHKAPSADSVQLALEHFDEGDILAFERLSQITFTQPRAIEPELEEKLKERWISRTPNVDTIIADKGLIHDAYDKFLHEGQIYDLCILQKLTGVNPKAESIAGAFEFYLKQGKDDSIWGLTRAIGQQPSEEALHATYRDCIQKNAWNYLYTLIQITGIAPSKDLVNQTYVRFLKEGDTAGFSSLMDVTGIEPDKRMLRPGVRMKLEEGSILTVAVIKRITGVNLPALSVNKAYELLLGEKKIGRAAQLNKICSIPIKKELAQETAAQLDKYELELLQSIPVI